MDNLSLATQPTHSRFLNLPQEIRDKIYTNLLSIPNNRTPKSREDGLRSSFLYDWNLHPAILATNHQIYDEAFAVFRGSNQFVMIKCATQALSPTAIQTVEEDIGLMRYNVSYWPRKNNNGDAKVPGGRMTIWLEEEKDLDKDEPPPIDVYVLQVSELHNFFTSLSIATHSSGSYCTEGIAAIVVLYSPTLTKEDAAATDRRELSLLHPMMQLRHLSSVHIVGAAPGHALVAEAFITKPAFEPTLISKTLDELITEGDSARQQEEYDVANAYFQRAHEYLHHFMEMGPRSDSNSFLDPAEPLAYEFNIMRHRALNLIEDDLFDDAIESCKIALEIINLVFGTGSKPGTNAMTRQRNCQMIRQGAERLRQHIKCEDVGRCYYYKSIAGRLTGNGEEEAQKDKLMAIGCCIVSDTVKEGEDIPRELLQLEMRTMHRFGVVTLENEGQLESEGEEDWETEDEDDDENDDAED